MFRGAVTATVPRARSVTVVAGLLVRLLAVGWLVVHFSLTVLYVLPVNPLTMAWETAIDRVIGRNFGQTWTLFAPNPIASDYALLVRPLARDAGATIGSADEGPWYDVSAPLWEEFRRNRLSAFDLAYRPQLKAMQMYLSGDPSLASWRYACHQGADPDACAVYEARMDVSRRVAEAVLARVASSFTNAVFPEPRFRFVALRIRVQSSVPWSKRDRERPSERDVDVGVFPIDRGVHPADFYVPRRLADRR